MSPNSIYNHTQQQIAQLEQALDETKRRTDNQSEAISELQKAADSIKAIGLIPSLSDVRKIADAIGHLVQSSLVVSLYNHKEMKKQQILLETALKSAKSPIVQAVLTREN